MWDDELSDGGRRESLDAGDSEGRADVDGDDDEDENEADEDEDADETDLCRLSIVGIEDDGSWRSSGQAAGLRFQLPGPSPTTSPPSISVPA